MTDQNPPNGERIDKGKGKSKDDGSVPDAQPTTTPSSGDPPSLFSKIAQSAAHLSRDLAAVRPSGGDLASLSSTSKAGAAGSSRGGQSLSSSEAVHDAAFSGRSLPSSSGAVAGSTSQAQLHAAAQEQAFSQFLEGADIDMTMPTEPIIGLDGGDNSAAEAAWAAAQQTQQAPRQPSFAPPLAVADQESRDGLDVVRLLSADGPVEEEPNYDDIELAEDEIAALKLTLFGDSHASSETRPLPSSEEWDNVLNFIPDFVRPGHRGYATTDPADITSTSSAKSGETRSALGMPHSAEATRVWLDQWHAVLTRYDDEVWGGLSPLVAQARDAVDQLKEEEEEGLAPPEQVPANTKALDRLRQILGHLRVDS